MDYFLVPVKCVEGPDYYMVPINYGFLHFIHDKCVTITKNIVQFDHERIYRNFGVNTSKFEFSNPDMEFSYHYRFHTYVTPSTLNDNSFDVGDVYVRHDPADYSKHIYHMLWWYYHNYSDFISSFIIVNNSLNEMVQIFLDVYLHNFKNVAGDDEKYAKYRGLFSFFDVKSNKCTLKLNSLNSAYQKRMIHEGCLRFFINELFCISLNKSQLISKDVDKFRGASMIIELSVAATFALLMGHDSLCDDLLNLMFAPTPPDDISKLMLGKWLPFNMSTTVCKLDAYTCSFKSYGEHITVSYINTDELSNFSDNVKQPSYIFKITVIHSERLLVFQKNVESRGVFMSPLYDGKLKVVNVNEKTLFKEMYAVAPTIIYDKFKANMLESDCFSNYSYPMLTWRTRICAEVPLFTPLFDYLCNANNDESSAFERHIRSIVGECENTSEVLQRIRNGYIYALVLIASK